LTSRTLFVKGRHPSTKEKNRERFRKNGFAWLNRDAGAGYAATRRLLYKNEICSADPGNGTELRHINEVAGDSRFAGAQRN